jgi:hypothetical protein
MTLFDELMHASRFARDPRMGGVLANLGLTQGPPFGIGWVEFHGLTYEPVQDGGHACLIVPVFKGYDMVDLAACSYLDRRIATRRDVGMVLGERFVARAVERQCLLRLFADPWRWLRAGRRGAVVLDWSSTGFLFDGVPGIVCDEPSHARRVHATTRRMADPPRLFFPKQRIH